MRTLRITDVDKETTNYLLKEQVGTCYTIGRSATCLIHLPEDSALSQQHCVIEVTERGIIIRDSGSTNGTLKKGERISEEIMEPGTEYTAGRTLLLLVPDAAEAAAPPAPKQEEKKPAASAAPKGESAPPAADAPADKDNGQKLPPKKQQPEKAPEGEKEGKHEPPHKKPHLTAKGETVMFTQGLREEREKPVRAWATLCLQIFLIGIIAGGCFILGLQLREESANPELPPAEEQGADEEPADDDTAEPSGGDDTTPAPDETDEEPIDDVEPGPPAEVITPDALPEDDGTELPARTEESYEEEEVPEDPKQRAVPPPRPHAQFTASLAKTHRLVKLYEKAEKAGFTQDDLPAECWRNPHGVYKLLAERTLTKLRRFEEKDILQFLESPANRLDLARLSIIRRVGTAPLKAIAAEPHGAEMLGDIMRDLNWCDGLLHSGSMQNGEQTLKYLLLLYCMDAPAIRQNEVVKKTATAMALEYARFEGVWDDSLKERYNYYANGYKERKLNALFATLQYWDMRLVVGFPPRDAWGEVKNLTWLRDNVRLPVERYLDAAYQINYRLQNVAGDSIFSEDSYAPIKKYTKGIKAWQHREMGGVCMHLSPYASYAALAAGLPSSTVGEPDHCSYVLRVGNEWKPGNSIYWNKSISRHPWNKQEWDFLILMQEVYSDRYTTLVADELMAMADFLGARKKYTAAFNSYELALKVQPLNWPGYERYVGYLKLKAPEQYDKWRWLHDFVLQGIAKNHYCAAAHLLAEFVYPGLGPLMKQSKERNKLFASFFRNIRDWGSNRWDITPLLDAQISYCQNGEERKDFLRDALFVLMQRPVYASSVLMWGNHYMQKLTDEKEKDRFGDALLLSMSRARMGNPKNDVLWNMFCEAISEAEATGDREIFQLIGRLARIKCRKHFPKTRARLPRLRGKLLSEKASFCRRATHAAEEACLHWSALQTTGGFYFTSELAPSCQDIVVQLEKPSRLNGVVLSLKEPLAKTVNIEGLLLAVSDDGKNWVQTEVVATYDKKSVIVFDVTDNPVPARFVRIYYHYDTVNGITLKLNAVHVYGSDSQ